MSQQITWLTPRVGQSGGDGEKIRWFVLDGPCDECCGCPTCPEGQQLAVEYNYIDVNGKPGLGRSYVRKTEPGDDGTGCKYTIDYGIDCAIQSVYVYCVDPNRPGDPQPVECGGC